MLDCLADILWEKDLEESFLRRLLDRAFTKFWELTAAPEEVGDE